MTWTSARRDAWDAPWDAQVGDPGPAAVIATARRHHPQMDATSIEQAWRVAARAHVDQRRQSGEPYITHPLAVAQIAASLGLDHDTVVAAILHDTVEDTDVTLSDVADLFGDDVAGIVDGVTKLDAAKQASREHAKVATLHKLLVALSDDVRVLLLKLCDRTHNMKTIFHPGIAEDKRRRVGEETMDVFVPLAARLGVWELKSQLEDLAFRALDPDRHREVAMAIARRSPEAAQTLGTFAVELESQLAAEGIDAGVTGRHKSLYSASNKARARGVDVDQLHDLLGVRVIVQKSTDLYRAIGVLHAGGDASDGPARWHHVPGTFDDYVATPKHNSYQSLHSTVMLTGRRAQEDRGQLVEVQVRTVEQHDRAEHGVLTAHWKYKAAAGGRMEWADQLVQRSADGADPAAALLALKADLLRDEVFVFTRDGEPLRLPAGATPIDVAYALHTDIGNHCVAARVNGHTCPLRAPLKHGDHVEIVTDDDAPGPRAEWLDVVVTPRARQEISRQVKRRRRATNQRQGSRELRLALGEQGLPAELLTDAALERARIATGRADVVTMLADVGRGDLPPHRVIAAVVVDDPGGHRVVTITCVDRVGLLADAAGLLATLGVPITAAVTSTGADGMARLALTLAAHPRRDDAMVALASVAGVTHVG